MIHNANLYHPMLIDDSYQFMIGEREPTLDTDDAIVSSISVENGGLRIECLNDDGTTMFTVYYGMPFEVNGNHP